eukprot:m.110227 g.110227  ORF g.110227 m.110227 type:complete len:55 (-) comp51795_c0_seq15:235-399(-)
MFMRLNATVHFISPFNTPKQGRISGSNFYSFSFREGRSIACGVCLAFQSIEPGS